MRPSAPERVVQRLDWTVIRRLDGVLQGDYRSLFQGHGLDLADIREYEPGDDVRAIDWNVTARLDTTYVRRYLDDREINAWFLLDLSPSIDFGTAGALKRELLVDFVTVLSRLLTRHGNRVGAVLYGRRVERVIPPRGGRLQVLRLVNELLRRQPLPAAPLTALGDLLASAGAALRRRSLVFVVSDFISAPGWERPLSLLARRHEVLAVRLVDPRELALPDIGMVTLADAETGAQLLVDTGDRGFQRRFRESVARREEELAATFRRHSVEVLSLSTDGDLVREVLRFALARKRRAAKRRAAVA